MSGEGRTQPTLTVAVSGRQAVPVADGGDGRHRPEGQGGVEAACCWNCGSCWQV